MSQERLEGLPRKRLVELARAPGVDNVLSRTREELAEERRGDNRRRTKTSITSHPLRDLPGAALLQMDAARIDELPRAQLVRLARALGIEGTMLLRREELAAESHARRIPDNPRNAP